MIIKKIILYTVLTATTWKRSQSLKCGQWNTQPCLGETDKRYDESSTNDIVEQSELWGHEEGFWMATQTSTQEMLPFNPMDLTGAVGVPYNESLAVAYVNITHSGSRRISHRYVMYPPAPQEFCDKYPALPFPNPQNSLGGGTCGVHGYTYFTEAYKVSSYEKDGSL